MKISECLLQTRNLLLKNGWCKGSLHTKTGQYCAMGAWYEVLKKSNSGFLESAEVLNLYDEAGRNCAGAWNDKPERTFEEVISLFEERAKYYESIGQ